MDDREDARTTERELAALHPASFGWALACCRRDHGLAEEVLQDAYCKVLDGRARFDRRSSLKTWLFGVIRMTAREHRRWSVLRVLRGARSDAPAELPDARRAPDSEAAARQRAERLSRALARLAERQREVLHLVFYEDLSIAEAAEVMGVALGTARQHYERGKHALSALIREEEGSR
ncbi:MAG: RNA polymerase sigma factor [Labilithrix sp.]|nr:RNA polymerase sigma factor [Labilithrix sp.]